MKNKKNMIEFTTFVFVENRCKLKYVQKMVTPQIEWVKDKRVYTGTLLLKRDKVSLISLSYLSQRLCAGAGRIQSSLRTILPTFTA